MIKKIISDSEIISTYPVIKQLRPHLDQTAYLQQVKRQSASGYQVAAFFMEDKIVAVAGYRILEFLAWGKVLYVDDLITDESNRSKGYGKMMLDWLFEESKKNGCYQFHLDSGIQRKEAHKFYLREKLGIIAYHFAKKVS